MRVGRSMETESRLVAAWGWGRGARVEVMAEGFGLSFWSDKNVPRVMITESCEYGKCH